MSQLLNNFMMGMFVLIIVLAIVSNIIEVFHQGIEHGIMSFIFKCVIFFSICGVGYVFNNMI